MYQDHNVSVESRKWRVDDAHAPQPVQLHIEMLRSVKEKLPRGEYVLLVSLYDRLGGHPVRWSNLKDSRRGRMGHARWQTATHPVVSDVWHAQDPRSETDWSYVPRTGPPRPLLRQ